MHIRWSKHFNCTIYFTATYLIEIVILCVKINAWKTLSFQKCDLYYFLFNLKFINHINYHAFCSL